MPRFTFRFGEINKEGTENRAEIDLDRIRQKLDEEGIVGDRGNRKWGRNPIQGDSTIYFEYIKEIPEEYPAFSDDDRIVSEQISRVKAMHFLLFDNGVYGFESRRGVEDIDVLRYIFDDFDERYDLNRFDSLTRETMLGFYKNSYEVRKLKAENIGERAPNPRVTDKELRELTEDTGLKTKSIIASVGRLKESLKEVSLFDDGIAKYSDLPMVKSRDEEDNIQKLRDSGRLDFGIEAGDEDEEEQASQIRNTVRSAMRSMFDIDVGDSQAVEDESNDED